MEFIQNFKQIGSSIMGINERNLNYVYKLNPRKYFDLADDKIKCKEVLQENSLACPRTYASISRIGDIQMIWQLVSSNKIMAIKPARGAGGNGILILIKSEDGSWRSHKGPISESEIFVHMSQIIMGMFSMSDKDKVLIEEYVESHDFFREIFPEGVPDIRVIMVSNKPVMAMLRLPTLKSGGKANLHQGGLGIGIDISNGKLMEAYDGEKYHLQHPDSEKKIAGMTLPMWPRLLELSRKTSLAFPLDYLGIDLVLDKNKGPLIMEINVRPGLAIQLANKKGLKEVL